MNHHQTDQLKITGFPLGMFQTNCYVVEAGEQAWIVDGGQDPAALITYLQDNELVPQAVLQTHGHLDHIAGLFEIRSAFPELPILIHEDETEFLTDTGLNLSAGHGFPIMAPEATGTIAHGEVLTLNGVAFEARHTPGHSPGGLSFISAGNKVALVGDTLFAGSIGRYDFPTSDGPLLLKSIQEQLYTLPDDIACLPGHGPATTVGQEKRTNPYVRA